MAWFPFWREWHVAASQRYSPGACSRPYCSASTLETDWSLPLRGPRSSQSECFRTTFRRAAGDASTRLLHCATNEWFVLGHCGEASSRYDDLREIAFDR